MYRSEKYILDETGEPYPCNSLAVWSEWFEKADRHIAKDAIGDFYISTVFLGLDHSFGNGLPILFETMVFNNKGRQGEDLYCKRYSFRDEALKGHQEAIEYTKRELIKGELK